jgi:hypothetical protein
MIGAAQTRHGRSYSVRFDVGQKKGTITRAAIKSHFISAESSISSKVPAWVIVFLKISA